MSTDRTGRHGFKMQFVDQLAERLQTGAADIRAGHTVPLEEALGQLGLSNADLLRDEFMKAASTAGLDSEEAAIAWMMASEDTAVEPLTYEEFAAIGSAEGSGTPEGDSEPTQEEGKSDTTSNDPPLTNQPAASSDGGEEGSGDTPNPSDSATDNS